MSNDQPELFDLLEEIDFCMLVTDDNGTLRSRPMDARIDKKHKLIRFMTARTAAKVEELHHDRQLNAAFSDNKGYNFASVSGRGTITTDRGLIKELWDASCDIWFEGDAETADVAVITLHPEHAEYWKNDTGTLVAAYEFAKAYFGDEQPDVGTNKKVDMV